MILIFEKLDAILLPIVMIGLNILFATLEKL